MEMTLLVTHAGLPLLLFSSPLFSDRPGVLPPPSPPGTLSLESDTGTVTVTGPASILGASTISSPGFPPEIVTYLQALPGAWCVAMDPTGCILGEWAAVRDGATAQAVDAMLPARSSSDGPGLPAFTAALADGVYAVASSHSWPPGARPPIAPPVHPAAPAAYLVLSRIDVRPTPPSGGFFGAIAAPLAPSPQQATAFSARLAAAISGLREVVVNGDPIGDNLLGVMDWGISVAWASSTPRSTRVVSAPGPYASTPAPPPCGWDPSSRTIYLANGLPPALDTAYMAAGLYAAHVSLTGQSAIARLSGALFRPSGSFPPFPDFSAAAAAEAARSWILLAEVATAGGPQTPAAVALSQLPWGRAALSWLTGTSGASSPAGYNEQVIHATNTAAAAITPVLATCLRTFYDEATSLHATWFDPRRRASLPFPSGYAGNTAASVTGAPTPYVCTDNMIVLPPGAPPEIVYTISTVSPAAGPVVTHLQPGAPVGSLYFDRQDGLRVFLPDIPANVIAALSSARRAIIIFADLSLGPASPQPVNVIDAPR